MRGWLLLVLGGVVIGFVALLAWQVCGAIAAYHSTPRPTVSGEAEFRAANRRIISGEEARGAFGNTPAAEALARQFSTLVAEARKEGFTEGDPSGFSLSKHRFLTYCRLNADSCVFLVHVPELRHFTPEARETLANLSWVIAHRLANDVGLPPGSQLAVGVKGLLNYEAVLIGGLANQDSPLEDISKQDHGFGLDKNRLFYPFFAAETAPGTSPVPATPPPK